MKGRRRPIAHPFRVAALLAILAALVAPLPAAGSREIVSYARVQDDATLRVGRQIVRLYGIYIPETSRTCQTTLRPVRCAPRAVNALEFKIQGFVRCERTRRHRDGSVTAVCYNDGEDLSAYLIERGWAVALPNAPFEYTVLEKIARHRNMGVWGMHADVITRTR